MRFSLLFAGALVAASSPAATLVGEATDLVVQDLAGVGDGWAAAGHLRPPAASTLEDGFVLRAGGADERLWALRLPGRPLSALSPLPDGGVLVGGGPVLARVGSDGVVAWQRAITEPLIDVAAISCAGWDCWAGGSEALLRIDALDGAPREALQSRWTSPLDGPMVPQRLLALDDGSVVVAGLILEKDFATAAACRVARSAVAWTQALGDSWPTDDANGLDVTRVDALAATRSGRIAVVAHDPWLNRTLLLTDAAGSAPLLRATVASAVAGVEPGAFVVASPELRVERWDGDAPSAERLVLGVAAFAPDVRLASLSDGTVLVHSGRKLIRLGASLDAADACAVTGWACCPGATSSESAQELHALFEPAPARLETLAPSFVGACAGSCLAGCEQACGDGRDDDDDGLADCADPACAPDAACAFEDTDLDGVVNRDDCAPADAHSWTQAEARLLVRPACRGPGWFVPRLHWTSPGGSMDPRDGATAWADVVGGRLADLRSGGGTASGTCLAARARATQWTAWDEAWRHDAAWWVVRPGNACGPGSWGDPALDAASPCR